MPGAPGGAGPCGPTGSPSGWVGGTHLFERVVCRWARPIGRAQRLKRLGGSCQKGGGGAPLLCDVFPNTGPGPSIGSLGAGSGSGEHPIFADAPCQAHSQVPEDSTCREGRCELLCAAFAQGWAGPLTWLCTAPRPTHPPTPLPPSQLCCRLLLAALGGPGEPHPALLALCWCRVGACGPEGPLELVDCRLGRGGVSSP